MAQPHVRSAAPLCMATSILPRQPIRSRAMFHWSERSERKRHPVVNGWRLLPARIDPPFEVCLSAVHRRRPLVPRQFRCPVRPSARGRREGCDLSFLTTPRWLRTEAPACNPAAPSFARSAADAGYRRGAVHGLVDPGGLASELDLRRRTGSGAAASTPRPQSWVRNHAVRNTASCGAGISFFYSRRIVPQRIPPLSVNVSPAAGAAGRPRP